MKKTYYFQHDYNARNDPKLQALIVEMGVAGIGIYWCLVEMLYEQDGEMPISSIKSIAYNLHVKQKTVERVIKDFGLFDYDDDKPENVEKSPKMFRNKSVLKRLNRIIDISEKRKRAIETRWKSKRDSESNEYKCNTNEYENDTNEVQTEYKSNTPIIKEKEIKEKEIKEDYKEEGSSLRSEPLSSEAVDANAAGEKIEVFKSEEEKYLDDFCKKVADYFNKKMQGKEITKIRQLTSARKASIKARLKESSETEVFAAIDKTSESDFLNGCGNRGFKASFDWLFRPRNYIKVLEGNYDNNRKNKASADSRNQFDPYSKRRGFDVTATSAEEYCERL